MTDRLQPPSGLADAAAQRALADVSRVFDSQPRLNFRPETATALSVAPGEIRRLAPRSGGQTVVLPAAAPGNAGQSVALFVSGVGALTVMPVTGTINGASSIAFAAGTYSLELFSDGSTWLTPGLSTTTIDALAGAGLSRSGTSLAVNGSTSITVTSDEVRRAALTGEVTAAANSNATTVVRSTDFSTAPWTGNHKFSGQMLLGAEQDQTGTGAINVTLGDVIRLRFSDATGNHTVGTVSGCAEGRLLLVEFSGTGTHTITHDPSTLNAFSCPGNVNLVITGRGGFIAVGRTGTPNWKVLATTN